MALNGIDISSWQSGINLDVVPWDFVIIKSTQGTGYTNPDFERAITQALNTGKAVGVYHYISGGNVEGEMAHFFNRCKRWNGKVLWTLDWEAGENSAWGDVSYLDRCVKSLALKTGRPPMIYASLSVYPHAIAEQNNCGKWIAQYASNSQTTYQASPWNENAYGCAIRQYSSNGRISGYDGPLDLNKFYGDRATWDAYVGGSSTGEQPKAPSLPSLPPFALPKDHFYGLITGPERSHGGFYQNERPTIKLIQQRLIAKGYVPGITDISSPWADGVFEKETADAVARFQKAEMPGTEFYGQLWWDDYAVLNK